MECSPSLKKTKILKPPSPISVDARFSPTNDYIGLFSDFLKLFNLQIKKNCLEKVFLLASKAPRTLRPITSITGSNISEMLIEQFKLYDDYKKDLISKMEFLLLVNCIKKYPDLRIIFLDLTKKTILLDILKGGPINGSIHSFSPGAQAVITNKSNRQLLISLLSKSIAELRQLIDFNDSDSSYFQTCSQDVLILKKETNDLLEFFGASISQIEFERGLITADIESLIYKIQTAEMTYCFEIYEEMITDYPLEENYQTPLDFHLLESNIKRIIEIKNEFIDHFNPRVAQRAPLAILENPFATEDFDYFIDLEETSQARFKLQIKFSYFSWEINGEFENLMLIQFLMNHMKKRFIMEPEIIGPDCSF